MSDRLDPASVRAAAGQARALGEQHRDTGDALLRSLERLASGWRGQAADAALTELSRITQDTRLLAHACTDAADVLTTCSGRLQHAREVQQRAARRRRPGRRAGRNRRIAGTCSAQPRPPSPGTSCPSGRSRLQLLRSSCPSDGGEDQQQR